MTGAATAPVETRPVTADSWQDFEALFSARGSPHYCWCMLYRDKSAHLMDKAEKHEAMQAIVAAGTPVGVLAYQHGEAIGWCSVAPRDTFPKLARSRAMPTGGAKPAWAVTCFFVKRGHRRHGVTRALLEAATDYAARKGAAVVEGYPFDTAGIISSFKGHSSVFRAAGFRRDGVRWFREIPQQSRSAGDGHAG